MLCLIEKSATEFERNLWIRQCSVYFEICADQLVKFANKFRKSTLTWRISNVTEICHIISRPAAIFTAIISKIAVVFTISVTIAIIAATSMTMNITIRKIFTIALTISITVAITIEITIAITLAMSIAISDQSLYRSSYRITTAITTAAWWSWSSPSPRWRGWGCEVEVKGD